MSQLSRRLPVGAEVQPDGSTHFRVWAPAAAEIQLILHCGSGDVPVAATAEGGGYHSVLAPGAAAGARYRYRVNGRLLADPASRFQPEGVFGPSQVVNPAIYAWRDAAWQGVPLEAQVLYEMHVGTFTEAGTWDSASERLEHLARTGITVVEVMPVADFPGRFGWGYDGVLPYAPAAIYGTPDDFRSFVDRAHHLGLGVILDVVYNHFGPSGCVHRDYAPEYFSSTYENEWGDPLNFDGPGSGSVREYFAWNAAYWIDEFHLDGLRLDATQAIHDTSPEHLLVTVGRLARAAAGGRRILIVVENERQDARLAKPVDAGGYGLDALWNDDFHHSAVVSLTGRNEAYYSDHRGTPQELISAIRHGFLFQGQRYAWQNQPRGSRTDGLAPAAFVNYLENHDQIANSGDGSRLHQRCAPGAYRAMTALLLLAPSTPLLFQGQEFGASTPFLYFADHEPDLAAAVRKGRAEFVRQFPSFAAPEVQARLAIPDDPATFARCKLQWREADTHESEMRLHHDLLALRRTDEAFRAQRRGAVEGAVLSDRAFVLRFRGKRDADERLLVINLGADLTAGSLAEPLVAPPDGYAWRQRWSTEDPAYGGCGSPEIVGAAGWRVPGQSATVLAAVEATYGGDARG